ncbi:MAG: HEAT repeat domain-containing protein, partial [candidate division Zixibacteria bacterium]|nr:HEAT repeat domain-containing protein [candidate division Zixibacteria bacterium]
QYMQGLDVNSMLFDRRMNIQDFTFVVESMVNREVIYNPDTRLSEHFRNHNLDCVQVNSELALDLFEERSRYRGEIDGDYSVRRLARDQMRDDPVSLARLRDADQEKLLEYGIDFDCDIIQYLLPERVAELQAQDVRAALTALVEQIDSDNLDQAARDLATGDYMALIRLTKYHPDHERIIANIGTGQTPRPEVKDDAPDPNSATGRIKIQTSQKTEDLLEELFTPGRDDYDIGEFCDSFARLLKTGQQPKAREIVRQLIDFLSSVNLEYRQKALQLTGAIIDQVTSTGDRLLAEAMTDQIVARLNKKQETFEYSEIIVNLFVRSHQQRQYGLLARLTTAMAGRRAHSENVTVYDSMAIKKAFETISTSGSIDTLIKELVDAVGEDGQYIRQTLTSIGSEEVAMGLARIISHPKRSVRQVTLKILAELGKSSLHVFARILTDDAMFEREGGRYELSDERWYVIRNTIFVLGSLRDPQAVPFLRERISDTDVRVRRELIAALEKIGGEDTVDCLMVMADDPDRSIREAAIITIGLVGSPEAAPLLMDIARRHPQQAQKAVTALGKMGGGEATAFLKKLLAEPQELAELAGGMVSKDDLRVAIIKSLGQIGDRDAIDQIKKFQEGQSATQKIFFRKSPVNKAIAEVLSKK